jgi:hypothetical protein
MRGQSLREKRNMVWMLFVVSISIASLSCAFLENFISQPTEEVPLTPTEQEISGTEPAPAAETPMPTESAPTDELEPTQEGSTIPDRPLGSGPWLLIAAEDGMWAVNPDGSGLTYLSDEIPLVTLDLDKAKAPIGGLFALVTSSDPLRMTDLSLKLLHLPSGEVETLTPLTSDETEPDESAGPGDPSFEVARTISGLNNLEWSPDARQLAFMGAMQGPTSDLYVYSFDSQEITQLTDGPSQGIHPSWSPDGLFIVHEGVGSLGTGAGFNMQGIWAVRMDDGSIKTLYPIPEGSCDEVLFGWISRTHFLVYTWSAMCGPRNLRNYALDSGNVEILWEDFFSQAVLSPVTGHVLLSVDQWTADCNPSGQEGMFIVEPGQIAPVQVLDFGTNSTKFYSSIAEFLVKSESKVFSVSPEGDAQMLADVRPGLDMPEVSPDGRLWAFAGSDQSGASGLWVGDFGSEPDRVFPQGARNVVWSPGGVGLFFFGDAGLFFAPAPDFVPILIGEDLHIDRIDPTTWVYQ